MENGRNKSIRCLQGLRYVGKMNYDIRAQIETLKNQRMDQDKGLFHFNEHRQFSPTSVVRIHT